MRLSERQDAIMPDDATVTIEFAECLSRSAGEALMPILVGYAASVVLSAIWLVAVIRYLSLGCAVPDKAA